MNFDKMKLFKYRNQSPSFEFTHYHWSLLLELTFHFFLRGFRFFEVTIGGDGRYSESLVSGSSSLLDEMNSDSLVSGSALLEAHRDRLTATNPRG